MRRLALFASAALMLGSSACAQKSKKAGSDASELRTELDSLSYILGSGLGQNVRQAEIEGILPEVVLQGLIDALKSDEDMKISQEAGNTLIGAFMQRKQAEKSKESADKAAAYMSNLASNSELKKSENGVYYTVVKQGSGAKPIATDKVKVHYEGRTTDGKVFDSSYERDTPAEFPLNRVIPGWTEMLMLMEVGTSVEATIPPELGYGERGSPPNIGPNEVLIFKIELIEIQAGQ